ncbi:MAG: DNA-binding protein [Parabacteroides sp.]|nr:DNA-binding protein [Parabacteroides sp.]
MAEYIMCQTNSLNEEGEPIVYPRMKLCGMCDMKQFAESIENGTTFTAAEVKGLLDTISSKLAYWMSNGYSVKLDGIGVFTPALGFKKGKSAETSDKERMNAQSLQVKGINFRADTQLVSRTNSGCQLERSDKKPRRSSSQYTPEERLALAKNYLEEHPFMQVADYCRLTGLCRTTASLELRRWREDPDSGIAIAGTGTHRVYIKKEEEK